ncbi:hypothetical protein B0H13DRAFT_2347268 [Mycena leptocephala]|nr:hypothetical protein B0H13DRAFT_2347268 [Mycena leptocephala]
MNVCSLIVRDLSFSFSSRNPDTHPSILGRGRRHHHPIDRTSAQRAPAVSYSSAIDTPSRTTPAASPGIPPCMQSVPAYPRDDPYMHGSPSFPTIPPAAALFSCSSRSTCSVARWCLTRISGSTLLHAHVDPPPDVDEYEGAAGAYMDLDHVSYYAWSIPKHHCTIGPHNVVEVRSCFVERAFPFVVEVVRRGAALACGYADVAPAFFDALYPLRRRPVWAFCPSPSSFVGHAPCIALLHGELPDVGDLAGIVTLLREGAGVVFWLPRLFARHAFPLPGVLVSPPSPMRAVYPGLFSVARWIDVGRMTTSSPDDLHPSQFRPYRCSPSTETPSASPPDAVSFSAANRSRSAAAHFHHQAGTFELEVQGPPTQAAGFEPVEREILLLPTSRPLRIFLFSQ